MDAKEVFEEWDSYSKKKQLLDRDFKIVDAIKNSERKIVAITGIRRCGKSSMLMLLGRELLGAKKKVAYINMEDGRISRQPGILDEALKWFGEEGFLLIDEITAAEGWEDWLARVHEQLKGRLRLIVTSSRASLIRPSKPLRGRILPFEFYPLSFKEYLSFREIQVESSVAGMGRLERALQDYMRYGGFPEVALAEEEVDRIRYLDSYFKDIIGLDIGEVTGEDINAVETFARYALGSTYFSASKCLNFFKTLGYKIGKEKLLKFETYSAASYLFYFLPIFSHNIKDSSQYPRKAYGGDTGFYYSATGKKDLGVQFENMVFIELERRHGILEDISYWKSREGFEADFVIKKGNKAIEIIQASYDISDERTRKREIRGAVLGAKEFGLKSATIITTTTKAAELVDGIKVKYIPVIEWLLG